MGGDYLCSLLMFAAIGWFLYTAIVTPPEGSKWSDGLDRLR